jgi:hypothetical protein
VAYPWEHKAYIEILPNQGRVNRVFENAGVPYGPRLELSSEASEEATKKRKQDVGVGFLAKPTLKQGWLVLTRKQVMMHNTLHT